MPTQTAKDHNSLVCKYSSLGTYSTPHPHLVNYTLKIVVHSERRQDPSPSYHSTYMYVMTYDCSVSPISMHPPVIRSDVTSCALNGFTQQHLLYIRTYCSLLCGFSKVLITRYSSTTGVQKVPFSF